MTDRKQYECELAEKQRRHLESIQRRQDAEFIPCQHDACAECVGTGVKKNGTKCIHHISCRCPKCTFRCEALR